MRFHTLLLAGALACAAAPVLAADVGHSLAIAGTLDSPPGDAWNPDEVDGVVATDFDEDGDRDLVALLGGTRVAVYLGDGTGGFAAPALYPLPDGTDPQREGRFIAGGDFNGDGHGDALVARGGGDSMLMGGPGGIGRWVASAGPDGVFPTRAGVLVRDVDHDGHLDWLVHERQQVGEYTTLVENEIAVYLGDGAGGARTRIARPLPLADVDDWDAGDLDGDGTLDLAIAVGRFQDAGLWILHGNGGTGWADPERLSRASLLDAVAVGDLDGDGRDDLAATMLSAPYHAVGVWIQAADGTLPARPTPRALPKRDAWQTPATVFAVDLDTDGIDDVVTLDHVHSLAQVLRTIGGTLTGDAFVALPRLSSIEPAAFDGDALAVGDFDGDGTPDAAVASRLDGITLLHGTTTRHVGAGTLPGAPRIADASDVHDLEDGGFAALLVVPPSSTGGLPLLGYRTEGRRTGSGDPFQPWGTLQTQAPILYGAYGNTGDFDIVLRAVNAVGVGPPSPVFVHRLKEDREDLLVVPPGRSTAWEHAGAIGMIVGLSRAATEPVTFDVATHDGTAVAGQDYVATTVTGTIAPGEEVIYIEVPLVDDGVAESSEAFEVEVSNLRGVANTGSFRVSFEISDEDGEVPQVSLSAEPAIEGTVVDGTLRVLASLNRTMAEDVVLQMQIAPGDALAGVDYVPSAPTLTIPAGEIQRWVEFALIADDLAEPDESLIVTATAIAGPVATPEEVYDIAMIRDDDMVDATGPLHARGDRFEVRQNAGPVRFDPFANDVFVDAAIPYKPDLVGPTPHGELVHERGDMSTLADDRIYYRPDTDFVGIDRHTYRLCENLRCAEATIEFHVRPIAAAGVSIETDASAGHADVPLERLPPLGDARMRTTALVAADEFDAALPVDPTPLSPWSGTGAVTRFGTLPAGDVRVLAEATADGEVDLYLGLDVDGDGVADAGETQCRSVMTSPHASCELARDGVAGATYWVVIHNRDTKPIDATAFHAAVRLDDGAGEFVATGPGHLLRGDAARLRLGWNVPALRPGDLRVGYVGVVPAASAPTLWTPVRIERTAARSTPLALVPFVDATRVLDPAQVDRHTFVDVPAGASELVVETTSATNVDLRLVPVADGSSPAIVPAPATPPGAPGAGGPDGNERVVVAGDALSPGRWYVVIINRTDTVATVTVRATVTAAAPVVRPGSYFNPARGGHGLVLYPAADQWAGLWYTYFQDRTPTWLYLQAPAPGVDGVWHSGLYRAAWNGTANRLTRVGEATITPSGPDAFRFTYTLDGETGSEPMQSLGRGCPMLGGQPLDASSHWFDPLRAGTGYSVQLWPEYEMFLAFVYDAQGVPRFLTAENPQFGGPDEILALEQLEGFCPLCARAGAPLRRDIGTFVREFDAGTLRIGIDGIYEATVPGWWTAQDDAQPLGGPGTTQGCAP